MPAQPPIVIKFGGSAFTSGALEPFARRVADLQWSGRRVVVVHGGGKDLTALLQRLGMAARFVGGLRVTDEETLDAAELVLSGRVNKRLARALAHAGVPAVGIAGTDGGLLRARVRSPELGRVGDVEHVDPKPLRVLWEGGYVPVVSPLASGPDGGALNVNADAAAAALAGALQAELRVLTDVVGVLGEDGKPLANTNAAEIARLRAGGVIRDGMLPKVEACLAALASGSPWATIQGIEAFLNGSDVGTRIGAR